MITILTHCIIDLIGMLMCCHLCLAYDSLGSFSIENLYLFHFIISEHDNTPKSVFVHMLNSNSIVSLCYNMTQVVFHEVTSVELVVLSQNSVLYSAPPIPAGIQSFQCNSGGILKESSHSSGIRLESCRIRLK